MPGQPGEDPAELGRVEDPGIWTMVTRTPLRSVQVRSAGVGEALDGVLGPRVHRLERDAALGQGRTHLHDGAAVARRHVPQGNLGAVDEAEMEVTSVARSQFLRCDLRHRERRRSRTPAFPTQTSIGPSAPSIRAAAASTASGSATSTTRAVRVRRPHGPPAPPAPGRALRAQRGGPRNSRWRRRPGRWPGRRRRSPR